MRNRGGKSFLNRDRLFFYYLNNSDTNWSVNVSENVALIEGWRKTFYKAYGDVEKGIFTSDDKIYMKFRVYISECIKNSKNKQSRGLKVLPVIVDEYY